MARDYTLGINLSRHTQWPVWLEAKLISENAGVIMLTLVSGTVSVLSKESSKHSYFLTSLNLVFHSQL